MRYRVPVRLGHVVLPPEGTKGLAVYLLAMPDGDPQALSGTAALIWAVAAEGEGDVPAAVADLLSQEVADVRSHVEGYLADLVAAGLLEEA